MNAMNSKQTRGYLSLIVVGGILVGCSSMPKQAPLEFTQASSEIEQADDEDVEERFPKTLERSRARLEQAIALWNKSRSYGDRSDQSKMQEEAISLAKGAETLASKARSAFRETQSWDSNMDLFTQSRNADQAREDGARRVTGEFAAVKGAITQLREDMGKKREAGRLDGIEYTQTAAHFGTNRVELSRSDRRQVEKIARTLMEHPQLKAELIGYADSRGTVRGNRILSRSRAQAVYDVLRSNGVARERVSIRSVPVRNEVGSSRRGAGSLQLSRRVDVRVYQDPSAVAE